MRLLNVETFELTEFFDDVIPEYAILSHRWLPSSQEVTFRDVEQGLLQTADSIEKKQGLTKIKGTCILAREYGLHYAWIDTCCIDKSSSAELSEAINSMFRWYQKASVCFAYLADVALINSDQNPFGKSQWFERGWTLQELVAPRKVIFYDCYWQLIGSKRDLQHEIYRVTGIDTGTLTSGDFSHVPLGRRMSWASCRRTSRIEDQAYSLLGLFDVNMPLLYGEGPNAFIRLQKKILKRSNDPSILQWKFRTESECKGKLEEFRTVKDWEPKKRDFLAISPVDFLPDAVMPGFPDHDMKFPICGTPVSDRFSNGDNHFQDAAVMIADLVYGSNDLYSTAADCLRPDSTETEENTARINGHSFRQRTSDGSGFSLDFSDVGLEKWLLSRKENPAESNDGPIDSLKAWSLFLFNQNLLNQHFPNLNPPDISDLLGNPFEGVDLPRDFLRQWSGVFDKNSKSLCQTESNYLELLEIIGTDDIALRNIQEGLLQENGPQLSSSRFRFALSLLDRMGGVESQISRVRKPYKALIRPTTQLMQEYARGLRQTTDEYHETNLACFMDEYARPLASLVLLRASSLVGVDAVAETWSELVFRAKGDAENGGCPSYCSPSSAVSPFILPSADFMLSSGAHACFMRGFRQLIRPNFRSIAISMIGDIAAAHLKHQIQLHLPSPLLDLELDGNVRLEIHEYQSHDWRRAALNILEDELVHPYAQGLFVKRRERSIARGAIKLSWTSPRLGIHKVAHTSQNIGQCISKAHQRFHAISSHKVVLPFEEPDSAQSSMDASSGDSRYLFLMIPRARGSKDVSVFQFNTKHPLEILRDAWNSQYREIRGPWWKFLSRYRPSYLEIWMAKSDGSQFRLCDGPLTSLPSDQDLHYYMAPKEDTSWVQSISERLSMVAFWLYILDPTQETFADDCGLPQRYHALDPSGLLEDKIWGAVIREEISERIISLQFLAGVLESGLIMYLFSTSGWWRTLTIVVGLCFPFAAAYAQSLINHPRF